MDDGAGCEHKIISISQRQLFPRVWQKAFLDNLYYRLNMVCLALDDRPAIRGPRSGSGAALSVSI